MGAGTVLGAGTQNKMTMKARPHPGRAWGKGMALDLNGLGRYLTLPSLSFLICEMRLL